MESAAGVSPGAPELDAISARGIGPRLNDQSETRKVLRILSSFTATVKLQYFLLLIMVVLNDANISGVNSG